MCMNVEEERAVCKERGVWYIGKRLIGLIMLIPKGNCLDTVVVLVFVKLCFFY